MALCGAKDGAQAAENAGAMGAKLWSRTVHITPTLPFIHKPYIGGICW